MYSKGAVPFCSLTGNEWVPVVSHPCQHLVLIAFQISAILIGVWWHFTVLICNCLITWCGTSFHMLNCHLYVFSEVSVKVFGSFLYWVIFLLSFKSSLYILDSSSLKWVCFAISFSLAYLINLLTLSFTKQEFLIMIEVWLINYFFHESYLWCCI